MGSRKRFSGRRGGGIGALSPLLGLAQTRPAEARFGMRSPAVLSMATPKTQPTVLGDNSLRQPEANASSLRSAGRRRAICQVFRSR
jgi:hypothetical protein